MIEAVGSQQNYTNSGGFYSTPELEKELRESRDHVISSSPLKKAMIVGEQFQNAITVYPAKGLTGSVNSNFYEFLTMGMVPYVTGSLTLMAVFNLASKYFEAFQTKIAASLGRKMALGVLFYGVLKSLSKKFIEYPVYKKTGVEMGMAYRTTKTELPEISKSEAAASQNLLPGKEPKGRKAFEYHKVYESVDFPRWDLLYDYKDGEPRNYYYDVIAKKFGLGENLTDSDQSVKPKIRQTVIRTRTLSTISSYLWAGLGVALAVQDVWDRVFTKNNGKLKIFSLDFIKRMGEGLKGSVKELWQGGVTKSPVKSAAGKTYIIAALASTVLGAVFSMYDFFGKRADVVKGKIDYDKKYTVG